MLDQLLTTQRMAGTAHFLNLLWMCATTAKKVGTRQKTGQRKHPEEAQSS
jgi:hypothetical protein